MGQEGAKDRLDMVSREPTWAKTVPRIETWLQESQLGPKRYQGHNRYGFKRASFGQEGTKDRLDMASREPTWAKKVPRID